MNTFGRLFRLTTFGESHGDAIGGVIDGCPPGIHIDIEEIRKALVRRSGKSPISTSRQESSLPSFISGIYEGMTTGTPLTFIIPNQNTRSGDYEHLKEVYRPSHADYTYQMKYGIRDHRGGGRASARETVARVVAGTIAAQILKTLGIQITAYTSQVGSIRIPTPYIDKVSSEEIHQSAVGCPITDIDQAMYGLLSKARNEGETYGGTVSGIITGLPVGIGSPLYSKLESRLADAMMSIGAAKAFEVGDGFALCEAKGSVANDAMTSQEGHATTITNHSGGIQGGISNGADIRFRVGFKPIPSIAKPQHTITRDGEETEIRISGRHDASVFPRVLPVVEAMAALVIIDEWLIDQAYQSFTTP